MVSYWPVLDRWQYGSALYRGRCGPGPGGANLTGSRTSLSGTAPARRSLPFAIGLISVAEKARAQGQLY
jgi:hypothetical protein